MNIDDLRTTLSGHGRDTERATSTQRLEGVRAKVAARRRAKAAGAVGGAAIAAVAAVALVPTVTGSSSAEPVAPATRPATQPATPPTGTPSVPAGPAPTFPATWNGNAMTSSLIAPTGAPSVSIQYTFKTADPTTSSFCSLAAEPSDGVPIAHLAFNGHQTSASRCVVGDEPGTSFYTSTGNRWADWGVTQGDLVTVSMWTTVNGVRTAVPGAIYGYATYDDSGETVTRDGVTVPVIAGTSNEQRYRLADLQTRRVTTDSDLAVDVPPGEGHAVLFGMYGGGRSAGARLVLDGEPGQASTTYFTSGPDPVSSSAHSVTVRATGVNGQATILVAVYDAIVE